eukprot:scaffold1289_cov274-Pinguiococcus_pyrenoidosus.AAC.3
MLDEPLLEHRGEYAVVQGRVDDAKPVAHEVEALLVSREADEPRRERRPRAGKATQMRRQRGGAAAHLSQNLHSA